jgi:hypothetical protein
VLEDHELFRRYGALKYFLEFNWGRIGLKLQHVRKPNDVRSAITRVPRVETLPAFRDQDAICFVNEGHGPVHFSVLRATRRRQKEAADAVANRSSELHTSSQKFASAQTSLRNALSEFATLACSLRIFTYLFAMDFGVQQLRRELEIADRALQDARKVEENLRNKKAAQEAWFAQNEIVQLRRSKRHEPNADNLAKAMAGMPDYGWFNSFRRCENLDIEAFKPYLRLMPPPYPYQLFEIVTRIVKRMKPLKLERIEKRLLSELRLNENTFLRETVKPYWLDMKEAFTDCQGKRLKRRELPYFVIGRFVDRIESGKSAMNRDLAKHAETELDN